ncbi:MAG: hypothetical protein ACRCWJ_01395 [Casimicrobium sp.]
MKKTAICILTAFTSSSTFAQAIVTSTKKDHDACPLITIQNPTDKALRVTVKYTHSGTTLGTKSSESNSFSEVVRKNSSVDSQIAPGASCRHPNRLSIDDVTTEVLR